MRVLIIALVTALAIALGASLYWGVGQRRELARMSAEADTNRTANGDLEKRLATSDRARLAAESNLQGHRDLNIRRTFPVGGPHAAPEEVARFNAAMDADPVWSPFFRKLEWRRVVSHYNLLLSALNIPPHKLAILEDLLVQRAIETRRISRQLRAPGGQPGTPEAAAGADRTTEDIDVKIETLVGADAARAVREWNSAVFSYGNVPDGPVAQDAVTLGAAGFTVTNDQLVRLALIRYEVHAENPEALPGAGGPKLDPKTGLTGMEERLLARDAEVLSPEEIAVLRSWAVEENQARAALDALRARYHIVPDRTRPPGAP
jgi:hypothetical protein